MRWEVLLQRESKNRLNDDAVRRKLKHIAAVAERNQTLYFPSRPGVVSEPVLVMNDATNEELWRYEAKIVLKKDLVRKPETAERQYKHLLRLIEMRAAHAGWKVVGDATQQGKDISLSPPERKRTPFVVPELTDEVVKTYFADIYDRHCHIRLIHKATTRYFKSLRQHQADPSVEIARPHVLLKGKPAGCKTRIFWRFKQWYEHGGEQERVAFLDAHSMTKAGLENWLLDKADDGILPEILCLEEIDKQDPANLLALTSVMGSGYFSKTNARIGHRRAITNLLVWASCNDEQTIRKFKNGFLWSRFAHKWHCVRPDRERMRQILLDKVAQSGGNPAWVDAVLEFAYDTVSRELGIVMDDPREMDGLLDGEDALLDGSYQRDLLDVLHAEAQEKGSLAGRLPPFGGTGLSHARRCAFPLLNVFLWF
jgi:hypothetical protein